MQVESVELSCNLHPRCRVPLGNMSGVSYTSGASMRDINFHPKRSSKKPRASSGLENILNGRLSWTPSLSCNLHLGYRFPPEHAPGMSFSSGMSTAGTNVHLERSSVISDLSGMSISCVHWGSFSRRSIRWVSISQADVDIPNGRPHPG